MTPPPHTSILREIKNDRIFQLKYGDVTHPAKRQGGTLDKRHFGCKPAQYSTHYFKCLLDAIKRYGHPLPACRSNFFGKVGVD